VVDGTGAAALEVKGGTKEKEAAALAVRFGAEARGAATLGKAAAETKGAATLGKRAADTKGAAPLGNAAAEDETKMDPPSEGAATTWEAA
jgi:hypothetical protein